MPAHQLKTAEADADVRVYPNHAAVLSVLRTAMDNWSPL